MKKGTATAERLYLLYERSKQQSDWNRWQKELHREGMARRAALNVESYEAWRAKMRKWDKSYGG